MNRKVINNLSKWSQLYQPLIDRPWKTIAQQETASIGHRYLLDYGFIEMSSNGIFHYLPLGQRVLEKLTLLIDNEMKLIGAQKVSLSCLTDADLWKTSGRWNDEDNTLFRVKDSKNNQFCLGPTHEESITNLISKQQPPFASHRFPLRLYQSTVKFRDEMTPRYGLLRAREFIMKDAYSFDVSVDAALESYQLFLGAYERIFKSLMLDARKVRASVGNIGGSLSDEFQLNCSAGQDYIQWCDKCNNGFSEEILNETNSMSETCPNCNSATERIKTLELAHCFLLGTKYSKLFNAQYLGNVSSGQSNLLEMGCFGIGISRLIGAIVDSFKQVNSNKASAWPWSIAPFKVCFIGPKAGSVESVMEPLCQSVANDLSLNLNGDVLYDDKHESVGKRLRRARDIAYPIIVVANKTAMQQIPKFELYDLLNNTTLDLTHSDLFSYVKQFG